MLGFWVLYSILGLGNGVGVGKGGILLVFVILVFAYLVSHFCITGKLLCNICFRLW